MKLYGEGNYTDNFGPVEDFYTLFRGIFEAFWEALRSILKTFGVDVEEGKTEEYCLRLPAFCNAGIFLQK